MNIILEGRKVLLAPFSFKADWDAFVEVHQQDKTGKMGQFSFMLNKDPIGSRVVIENLINNGLIVWSIFTKEGKATRRVGFVYLNDVNTYSAFIQGIMDQHFARGLIKEFRKKKYTYSEDALRTLVTFVFEKMSLQRVQADMIESNHLAIALLERVGFRKEGLLKKAVLLNGEAKNIVIMGLLKEEYK